MTAVSVDSTVGALEIGASFSVFLFGIVTMQTYMYWSHFYDDRLSFRLLVTAIWLLELGHTIAVSYELYKSTIFTAGISPSTPQYPIFGVVTIISGFITTIVQLFFSYRLWTVIPSPWHMIGLVCGLTALARCGMSTYIGVEATSSSMYVEDSLRFERFVMALLVTAAIIDVSIAASMLWFLLRKRERSLTRLMKVIDHLILITIRTGLITSITAVTVLILYKTMPENYIYLAVFTLLAKLYSNSLLSSLNSRNSLRDSVSKSSEASPRVQISSSQRAIINESPSPSTRKKTSLSTRMSGPICIEMETTTETRTDGSIC